MNRFQILKGENPPPPPILEPKHYNLYRAREEGADRCGLIYDYSGSLFTEVKVHFFKKLSGKFIYFLCKNGECCTKLGPPKLRIGTILIKYSFKENDYEIFPWIFGQRTYRFLKTSDEEFPLMNHDFIITCTHEKFQCINLMPCPESHWQKYLNITRIINEAEPVRIYLKKILAADFSEKEIVNLIKMQG